MYHKLKDLLRSKETNALETCSSEHNVIECSKKTYKIDVYPTDMIVGKDVLTDLEIFVPYDNESYHTTVFHFFQEQCSSEGSKTFLKNMLENPIHNAHMLEKRKDCFSKLELLYNDNDFTSLKKTLKNTEKDFLWFFSQKEKAIDELLNSIYFSYWMMNKLNDSSSFMTSYNFYKIILSPMIGILSPVIYFVIPFIILKIKFGKVFQMSFTSYVKMLYKSMTMSSNLINLLDNKGGMLSRLQTVTYVLSLVFYFQGMFNTISVSRTTYKIIEYISTKVNNAFIYLKSCTELNNILWNEIKSELESCFIANTFDPVDESFLKILHEYKPFNKFTIFSNFGNQLVKYKKFDQTEVLNIVNKTYILDGLLAIIDVKKILGMSYTHYVNDSSKPFVTCKQAWHLCIDKNVSVKNNISFNNAIITGPNAGGKSTLIKTLCLIVLLSQTFTISTSESTVLTPFYFINTQINIPDCKGVESLFEAEMNRCLYTLSIVKAHPDKKSLIVMDEIFNSTNLVEAIAGAYSILQKLSEFKNVITIITTHFVYLCKLKKHTTFECFKMNVMIDSKNDKIDFPYILSKGVSKQYVALELLKKRGFDDSIITNALKIKQKLIKRV
jgi:hypothetical protein